LIEVRQSCLRSSRIAEISVPAWPIPIHQTKLMMSNAQPTGWLLPQMPMPFNSSQPTDTISPFNSRNAMKKTMYQGIGCRPRSTTLEIFSVTDVSV
jgi:hypothetical protein